MKRIIGVFGGILIVLFLAIAFVTPVFAQTPDVNSSHIAQCATLMGGQHVAACAQTMDRGVSTCAQMSGYCNH